MSLTTLVLEIVLAIAGAIGIRQRRDPLFVIALVAGAMGSAVSVAQYVATQGIWWYAPWDAVLAPAAVFVVVAARGVPAPLAARLHIRSGSPDVDFDRELLAVLVELGRILDDGPRRQDRASIESWITQATARGEHVLRRLERLEAPNPEWQDLLGAYIHLTRKTVAAIPAGVTDDDQRRLVAEGDELARRYESLRRRM